MTDNFVSDDEWAKAIDDFVENTRKKHVKRANLYDDESKYTVEDAAPYVFTTSTFYPKLVTEIRTIGVEFPQKANKYNNEKQLIRHKTKYNIDMLDEKRVKLDDLEKLENTEDNRKMFFDIIRNFHSKNVMNEQIFLDIIDLVEQNNNNKYSLLKTATKLLKFLYPLYLKQVYILQSLLKYKIINAKYYLKISKHDFFYLYPDLKDKYREEFVNYINVKSKQSAYDLLSKMFMTKPNEFILPPLVDDQYRGFDIDGWFGTLSFEHYLLSPQFQDTKYFDNFNIEKEADGKIVIPHAYLQEEFKEEKKEEEIETSDENIFEEKQKVKFNKEIKKLLKELDETREEKRQLFDDMPKIFERIFTKINYKLDEHRPEKTNDDFQFFDSKLLKNRIRNLSEYKTELLQKFILNNLKLKKFKYSEADDKIKIKIKEYLDSLDNLETQNLANANQYVLLYVKHLIPDYIKAYYNFKVRGTTSTIYKEKANKITEFENYEVMKLFLKNKLETYEKRLNELYKSRTEIRERIDKKFKKTKSVDSELNNELQTVISDIKKLKNEMTDSDIALYQLLLRKNKIIPKLDKIVESMLSLKEFVKIYVEMLKMEFIDKSAYKPKAKKLLETMNILTFRYLYDIDVETYKYIWDDNNDYNKFIQEFDEYELNSIIVVLIEYMRNTYELQNYDSATYDIDTLSYVIENINDVYFKQQIFDFMIKEQIIFEKDRTRAVQIILRTLKPYQLEKIKTFINEFKKEDEKYEAKKKPEQETFKLSEYEFEIDEDIEFDDDYENKKENKKENRDSDKTVNYRDSKETTSINDEYEDLELEEIDEDDNVVKKDDEDDDLGDIIFD